MLRQKPELLIPASSLEVLRTAVIFGADAVYIGGEAFGLRAKAKNFSMEEMAEGIAFAHAHQVKVYVTANILADIIIPLLINFCFCVHTSSYSTTTIICVVPVYPFLVVQEYSTV